MFETLWEVEDGQHILELYPATDDPNFPCWWEKVYSVKVKFDELTNAQILGAAYFAQRMAVEAYDELT